MSKTLIILQGPPASGKSTWVHKFTTNPIDDRPIFVVSRDSIRHSMGEYNMEHEDEVTRIEEEQTIYAMKMGFYTIINDGTNLNPKYLPKWEKMAKEYGYEVEYKQFYVPFEEAVKRDENPDRLHHVGKKVIKRFYRMYYPEKLEEESRKTVVHPRVPIDDTLPKAVMCDLDGTIAWMQNRSPYDRTTVSTDIADPRMVQLLEKLYIGGAKIIFVSGREGTEQCRRDTEEWIRTNLPFLKGSFEDDFLLFMRHKCDYRGDEIIKKEIYDVFINTLYDVVCVFDDRDKVVSMWRNEGLLCCQVNYGDF